MQEHQEILNAIEAVQCASAKRDVLRDLCTFLEKYRRKQDAQLRDISRKHEKAKALGRKDKETLRISTQKSQLQCEMIEALTLQKEFLERCIEAGDEVNVAYNHLKELHTRETENSTVI